MTPALLGEFSIGEHEIAHRAIANRLRERIGKGLVPAGALLPSTQQLAQEWHTSYFTVHTALNTLVREGLLERRHGSGTHVLGPNRVIRKIGVYYRGREVWSDEEMTHLRNVHTALERQLSAQAIATEVFFDTREATGPEGSPLPGLKRAVELREIQGLVLARTDLWSFPRLQRLPLPVAFLGSGGGQTGRLYYDHRSHFREIFRRFRARGLRSVGLISNVSPDDLRERFSDLGDYYTHFRAEADAAGLETRPGWIVSPPERPASLMRFGYDAFHALWREPALPDALLVFPDMTVRGVILAVVETRAFAGGKILFAFHRNRRVQVLCPFPAWWSVIDEEEVASALITLIRRQHQGKPAPAIGLPIRLETADSVF